MLAGVAAAGSGAIVLAYLLRYLPVEEAPTSSPVPIPGRAAGDRRTFLTLTGTAGAVGVLAAVAGRSLAERSRQPPSPAGTWCCPQPTATYPGTPASAIPTSQFADEGLLVDGLSPLVTPTKDFYRIDTALVVPQVRTSTGGACGSAAMVDYPVRARPTTSCWPCPRSRCPSPCRASPTRSAATWWATPVWQGVPLPDLLERAGVRPGGEQIVGRSLDGFTAGFPTAPALDGRVALVAVGMNGEPLPGQPRLPGPPGRRGALRVRVGHQVAHRRSSSRGWDYDGYWIPRAGPRRDRSRPSPASTCPEQGRSPAPGPIPVAGVAWAPGRGISKVEVQVDDGPWHEAELGAELSDDTWRQWVWTWDASAGDHTLRVRATDGTGETQTSDEAPPDPDGATGWHVRKVKVKE